MFVKRVHDTSTQIGCLTWWAVEENASGRSDVEAFKKLRVDQGKENHLLQGFDVTVQAPNLVKAH